VNWQLTLKLFKGNHYSYPEWQNWWYQNSETPEPIVTKFGIDNYVGDMTHHAEIQADCLNRGIRQTILMWFNS